MSDEKSNSAKAVALARGISHLKASGFPFAVIYGDGVKHGDLTVLAPGKHESRNQWRKRYPDYIDRIRAMEVGGEPLEIKVLPGDDANGLRVACLSNMRRLHSGDSICVVRRCPDGSQVVECLRA